MEKRIQQVLGENIRAIHEASGLSKVDFALQLGISRVELDVIEDGRANPKLLTLNQIARNLGKEAWELIK